MAKVIKLDDIKNALEAADVYETDDAIVESYTGRGFAKPGFGIKIPAMSHAFAFFASLGEAGGLKDAWEDDEADKDSYLTSNKAYELACKAKVDNLGHEILVYFPGWTLAD